MREELRWGWQSTTSSSSGHRLRSGFNKYRMKFYFFLVWRPCRTRLCINRLFYFFSHSLAGFVLCLFWRIEWHPCHHPLVMLVLNLLRLLFCCMCHKYVVKGCKVPEAGPRAQVYNYMKYNLRKLNKKYVEEANSKTSVKEGLMKNPKSCHHTHWKHFYKALFY